MRFPILALSTVLGVAACGGSEPFTDAGVDPDARPTPDGEAPDADLTGEITVTTFNRCCGQAPGRQGSVELVVVEPDGTVETQVTDAAGEATFTITAGASVTALYRMVRGGRLTTYVAVEPGDQLVFGDSFIDIPPGEESMRVAWPPLEGASSIHVYHSCGETPASPLAGGVTLRLDAPCRRAVQDLLFVATVEQQPTHWGILKNVAWDPEAVPTLSAWQTAGTFEVITSNVPAEVGEVSLAAIAMLNDVQAATSSIQHVATDGFLGANLAWANGGDRVRFAAHFNRAAPTSMQQHVYRNLPASAVMASLSDPITLPWISDPVLDVADRAATWTLIGPGSYDGAVVELGYYRSENDMNWTLIIPPGVATIALPDLPANLDRFEPAAGDFTSPPVAKLLDLGDADGYRALRQRPEWQLRDDVENPRLIPDDELRISTTRRIGFTDIW